MPKLPDRAQRVLRVAAPAATALLFAYGAWRAYRLAWTCDDAFISYRYAHNLVHGDGLVFNRGERVEGYTNPLFTLAIAGALALGREPRLFSMLLGGIAYLSVAALLVVWFRRSQARTPFSLGAGLWLIQDDLHSWATGGLETSVFAAFAFGGFLLVTSDRRRTGSALLGGFILALACLTRPDGVLFAFAGALGAAFMRSSSGADRPLARAAFVAAPIVGALTALAAFKLAYYGRLLPTTYYAKSAALPYYSQGLVYVGLYFVKHWALALACIALPVLIARCRCYSALAARRDAWLALCSFLLFAAYVAHSAGDYMFARRLVPALPFLFAFLDAAAATLPAPLQLGSTLGLLVASFFPYPLFPADRPAYVHGVTDERLHYPKELIELRRRQGLLAHELFASGELRAAFAGGMCAFAYYSELPYLVEPNGLTQYWIAEQPLARRSPKVGHEKGASRSDLRAHRIRLIFQRDWPIPAREPRFDELLVARALRVELLSYDDAWLARVGHDPRVRFQPIAHVLAEAQRDIGEMSCDDARATVLSLSSFYAGHDAALEPLRAALARCQ